ncbi:hypothetical protein [Winogradskyella arenosi]|uniref:DUF4352 domain-containing protein n=1 Tax=Winogradskyella arenosi TaxID=533325 RepID=A0A368ZDJ0_9FLAO|nr:hypothetical protein [Winogradskyella arenosi]RCW91319.1 hypothetical protein DFQ08_103146 [Winogradskyella arenosi]
MKTKLLLLLIIIFSASCSSPLDRKFNENTAKQDIQELKAKMDSTDFSLMTGNMMRLKFQGETLEDMTYSEILEDGKKWKSAQEKIELEQKELAAKALRIENEKIKRLSESVLVSCFSKGFTKYSYEDYITYKFIIQNKSNKNIRAIKGSITFTNLFDEDIKSLNLVYDQPINAGAEVTYNAQTDYNQFTDSDKALRNKDLKDLKVVWKPEKIIFEDGTLLE